MADAASPENSRVGKAFAVYGSNTQMFVRKLRQIIKEASTFGEDMSKQNGV